MITSLGPKCVQEVLDEQEARLFNQEQMKMAVDVTPVVEQNHRRSHFKQNRLQYKEFASSFDENSLHGQPLVGQRR